uniref:Protein kinase domain-containing protein n=1 Tax=Ganoderma boninense TaxID=34458 RepID=A0A5K1JRC6_9APHY|nr:Uncharacterized protein [Ganoderma boninense]
MLAAYGYFVFHDNYPVPSDGPRYIYVNKDPFVIGTGPESDWTVSIQGLKTGQIGTVCRLVLRDIRGRAQLHIVRDDDGAVQLQSTFIRRGQYYALGDDNIVKIPRRVEGSTVILWSILTYKEIQPNSIFTQYQFTKILGTGGFGVVHEAVSVATGHRHAVKVVRKMRCLQTGTSKDPVQKEVEMLKAQNHPYIVTLDSAFQDDRFLYLVMELVAEGSLHDLIVRETRLSKRLKWPWGGTLSSVPSKGESDAKLVTLDVCSALTYLHAMAIVHRDIKPANILIQSRSPLSVKVSDFGLAKIVDGENDLKTLCGTPEFMAPEIGPLGGYDYKVDTWALGVTLFAMLSGRSPFSGREEDCRIQWNRLPDNISKLGTQLVCRMLTVNPKHRPAASEIANHSWFVVLVNEQRQVTALPRPTARPAETVQPAETVRPAETLRPTKTARPTKRVRATAMARQPQPLPHDVYDQRTMRKCGVIALLVVGLMFEFNAWQDILCRMIAIVTIARFAQMS